MRSDLRILPPLRFFQLGLVVSGFCLLVPTQAQVQISLIEVDNPEQELKPGMPADAFIKID